MRVKSAEFYRSVAAAEQLPTDSLPHIAFGGRSNVGKSSLINKLLNRKRLALTSSTPGKTRLLNFYRIDHSLYFVDLPGYGYAKVSQAERRKWRQMIEGYVKSAGALRGVVHIIDARHGPTQLDLEMLAWLHALRMPTILVATKADKLSRNALEREMRLYLNRVRDFGVEEIRLFSARTGLGSKELWNRIMQLADQE